MKTLSLISKGMLIALLVLSSCQGDEIQTRPENIILLIGDGMGLAQVHAAMISNNSSLNIERCTHTGLQKTWSATSGVTDSGAAGTALATGYKTYNGAISVDSEGTPLVTILELAENMGLSTGLLATSTITHATPAAFAAHNIKRSNYEEIAEDMSISGVDVIIGGGLKHFTMREDGRNLLEEMVDRGYFSGMDITGIPVDHDGPVVILPDSMAMPSVENGRDDILVRSTALAINRLSANSKGFFMMVEGSQIDWEGHDNNTGGVIAETLDFDRAVGKAIDYAEISGNTLVIITADHETGGMAVTAGGGPDKEIEAIFSSEGHTGIMVPVYAYGPGAEEFTGLYDNTDIFHKMKALFGF